MIICTNVALRKESVDRNYQANAVDQILPVALRKESVDRNGFGAKLVHSFLSSLSARRAWIEISTYVTRLPRAQVALRKESVDRNRAVQNTQINKHVALRKESVDRNLDLALHKRGCIMSLSARRAWIEIILPPVDTSSVNSRSPQGERG